MATSASPHPSPSSSSTSLPFPSGSPTKESFRSNPHPYAIRTTSTGILTRSNSTHSTSSASHHFIPSSPTVANKGSKIKQGRPSGGHRYSRSLTTTELPRPLPVPPKTHRRSDTAPSSSQPNLLGGGEDITTTTTTTTVEDVGEGLPEDPRLWTPSQLSTYLSSSLRVTSGDLPQLVAQDIAGFTLSKKITGRKFLRLTEGDLVKYGLNQRWQDALLRASRSLRNDSLRERIWSPSMSPDYQEEDVNDDSYSSTSSYDSRKGRSESIHGRVKGMVASIEGNGPSRPESPSRRSRSSVSSVQGPDQQDALHSVRSRPRPHSDSYPSLSYDEPMPDQKREPRLLPYPPSSPPQAMSMSPIHSPFGPYGSPMIPPPQNSAFTVFSPQYTGTTLPPENPVAPDDISTFVSQPQPQAFESLFASATSDPNIRPLPFPPHSAQIYQPLISSASAPHGGVAIPDDVHSHSTSAPPPHGLSTSNNTTQQVPHVQFQHVPDSSQTRTQGQEVLVQALDGPNTQLFPPHQHQPPPQSLQILAPQPRHGLGRESPTKLLEEKLEELLEPRPRSRVFPGQAPPTSHSRVPSGSTPSRPRSRVPSMNLALGGGGGSVNGKSKSVLVNEYNGNVSVDANGVGGDTSAHTGSSSSSPQSSLGVNGPAGQQQPHHPRTRVISLSRAHTHRLSGVEAWGESHRHTIVVPSNEDLNKLSSTTEEGAGGEGGGGGVKEELEDEQEVGIEALLEKEPPPLPLPLALPKGGDDITIITSATGHGKDGSNGSIGGGSINISHSRSGSLREPKSSVITLVERKSSYKLPHKKKKEEEEEEEGEEGEESMETLLAKTGFSSTSLGGIGGIRRRSGLNTNTNTNTKKQTRMSGAEAWEMLNVDTVKHVEGNDGTMNRSIENIFSPVARPPSATITTPVPHGPRPSPSPQNKTKLKPKSRKPLPTMDATTLEMKSRLDDLETKERQLERSVDETRKIAEEMKGRLEIVERWIADRDIKKIGEQDGKGRRNVWAVLSTSRVPGMLGLSAWFGVSPSPSATSSSTGSTQSQSRTSLIHRLAKMGLSLGTYTVLFGIGICVVLLRSLGKMPGTAAAGGVFARLAEVGTRMRNGLRR